MFAQHLQSDYHRGTVLMSRNPRIIIIIIIIMKIYKALTVSIIYTTVTYAKNLKSLTR